MIDGLVSIITPAYNCEKYIAETIESVLEQTYKNWEMIIVNDCSIDNTEAIVNNYTNSDNRVKLYNLKSNSGVVMARNKALEVAKGRYIAFLDSDDLWKENKLESQINFMKENNYAFVFSSYEVIDDNGQKTGRIVKAPKCLDYKKSIGNTSIGCLTVVIDKMITGNFYMPKLEHGEDHATWVDILSRGFNAYSFFYPLAFYRISSNSLTANKIKVVKKQWNNYRNYYNFSILKSTKYFVIYVLHAILKRI